MSADLPQRKEYLYYKFIPLIYRYSKIRNYGKKKKKNNDDDNNNDNNNDNDNNNKNNKGINNITNVRDNIYTSFFK